jgi:hypothetical protein
MSVCCRTDMALPFIYIFFEISVFAIMLFSQCVKAHIMNLFLIFKLFIKCRNSLLIMTHLHIAHR